MTALRRSILLLLVLAAFAPAEAGAAGGRYVFDGGSEAARAQVHAALEASSFDWDVVPGTVVVRIRDCGCAGARPGLVVLDERLLARAPYGVGYTWAIVQHEFAHQVWDLVLDDGARALFADRLGAQDLCGEAGARHDDQGCERFANTLAWAYWRDPSNPLRTSKAMRAAPFRALMAEALSRRSSIRAPRSAALLKSPA